MRRIDGRYAWIEPIFGKTRQRNPSGVTNEKATQLGGLYIWYT
jgi:hypothetical protein